MCVFFFVVFVFVKYNTKKTYDDKQKYIYFVINCSVQCKLKCLMLNSKMKIGGELNKCINVRSFQINYSNTKEKQNVLN